MADVVHSRWTAFTDFLESGHISEFHGLHESVVIETVQL